MFDLSAAFDTADQSGVGDCKLALCKGRYARVVFVILDWESAGVCSQCYSYVCVT